MTNIIRDIILGCWIIALLAEAYQSKRLADEYKRVKEYLKLLEETVRKIPEDLKPDRLEQR
jgi:hypothetical protein